MLLFRNFTLVPFRLKPSVLPVATCHFSTTNFNPSPAQAQKTGDEPHILKDFIKPPVKRPVASFVRFTLEKIKQDKENLETPVPYHVALRECAAVWNKLSDAEKLAYATPPKLYEEYKAHLKKWHEGLSDEDKTKIQIQTRRRRKVGYSLFLSETLKDAKGDKLKERRCDRAVAWKSLSTEQRAEYTKRAADTFFDFKVNKPPIKRPVPSFTRFHLDRFKQLKTPVRSSVAVRENAAAWNNLSDAEKRTYATPPKLYEEHRAYVKKWNEGLSDEYKKALKIRRRRKVGTGYSLFLSETFKVAKGGDLKEKHNDRALVWKSFSTEQKAKYTQRAAETLFGVRAKRAAQRERASVQEARMKAGEEAEKAKIKAKEKAEKLLKIALLRNARIKAVEKTKIKAKKLEKKKKMALLRVARIKAELKAEKAKIKEKGKAKKLLKNA